MGRTPIAVLPYAYSDRKRPPIPIESAHLFQGKAPTHSGRIRPPEDSFLTQLASVTGQSFTVQGFSHVPGEMIVAYTCTVSADEVVSNVARIALDD